MKGKLLRSHLPRGATLAEVLVVSVLALIVTGVTFCVLLLAKRSWVMVSSRASACINSEVALERVRRDLQDSSVSGITIRDGAALCFLSARDENGSFRTDSDGNPQWQAFVVYYVDSTLRSLRRRRVPAGLERPLTQEELTARCDGTGNLVAYDVIGLNVAASGRQITVTVRCATDSMGKANHMEMSTEVIVRN
jgi:hypothetical protein